MNRRYERPKRTRMDVPGPDPGIRSAAVSMIDRRDYRSAEILLRDLLREFPDDPALACLMAECYFGSKDLERAEFWFRKTVRLLPSDRECGLKYNRFRIENLNKVPDDRPRFLVGPMTGPAYHFSKYADCIYFGGADIPDFRDLYIMAPGSPDIRSILESCPGGFRPDNIICIYPEKYPPPINIDRSGIETIGIYSDITEHPEAAALTIPLFDTCLTRGHLRMPEVLLGLGARKSGIAYFADIDIGKKGPAPRDIDILYLAPFSHPLYDKNRLELLKIISPLADEYRLQVADTDRIDYKRLIDRARLTLFSRPVSALSEEVIDVPILESITRDSLCFVDEGIDVLRYRFRDKTDVIFYNKDNLLSLIAGYLRNEGERQRIAESGRIRALREFAPHANVEKISNLIRSKTGFRISPERRKISRAGLYLGRAKLLFITESGEDWDSILNLYEQAHEEDPSLDAHIENDLGVISTYRGDCDRAESHFGKACLSDRPNPIYYANRILNRIHFRGDFDGALELLREPVPDGVPDEYHLLPLLILCDPDGNLIEQKHKKSIYFIKIQNLFLKYPEPGDEFFRGLKSIVTAEINKAVGYQYYRKAEYARAIEHYRNCEEEYGDTAEMKYLLYLAYLDSGDDAKALENIKAAHELQPLDVYYLARYCSSLMKKGVYAEIWNSVEIFNKINPDPPAGSGLVYYYRAASAEMMKHPESGKAIRDFVEQGEIAGEEKVYLDDGAADRMARWNSEG